jgi:hypothetical protein
MVKVGSASDTWCIRFSVTLRRLYTPALQGTYYLLPNYATWHIRF